jgi:uncharacterized GH25 family protein
MIRRIACAAIGLLFAASAIAHDFWIAPTRFRPELNSLVGLHLLVGHLPKGEAFPRSEARIEKFVVVDPSGVMKDVAGKEAAAPAGIIRVTESGLYVVGYRSRPSAITLDAAKFEAYLREEGLVRIIEERAARGESSLPGRELFSRSAKTIIATGDGSGPGFDRVLGFRMEVIAEANPYFLKAGDELPVRLVFDGAPLEGVEVHAACAEDPDAVTRNRTDKDGRVRVRLSREGHWLLNSVHMVRADAKEADWESVWASLTFATQGAVAIEAK